MLNVTQYEVIRGKNEQPIEGTLGNCEVRVTNPLNLLMLINWLPPILKREEILLIKNLTTI